MKKNNLIFIKYFIKGQLLLTFFIFQFDFSYSQQSNFVSNLSLLSENKVKNFTNNPYKLITECFFEKDNRDNIIYGYRNLTNDYSFNLLNVKKNLINKIFIDVNSFKQNISKEDYKEISFYGISSILLTSTKGILSIGDNSFYFFNYSGQNMFFDHKSIIPDSIDFNKYFVISDSCLLLLDYKARFKGIQKIKAYKYNIYNNHLEVVFYENMGSNSASYDKTNTRYYDFNRKYFLLTDNLDYKIYLFDINGVKIDDFKKVLNISENTRNALNPIKSYHGMMDTISLHLRYTPRIYNTQFINDTDIIVNYSTFPSIKRDEQVFKNSFIDLLTVRNGLIIYKKTFLDEFIYVALNFNKTNKISSKTTNPYLRNQLFSFFASNCLITFNFEHFKPKSNTSYEKYLRKAKIAVLNLKSDFKYSIYEFHN